MIPHLLLATCLSLGATPAPLPGRTVAAGAHMLAAAPLVAAGGAAQQAPTGPPGELQAERLDLSGTVVDTDERPLPGVGVQLIGQNGVVVGDSVTDGDGRFTFADVARGTYQVRASLPPFQGRTEIVTVAETAPELTIELGGGQLEETVTVTASRGMLRSSSDIPATVRAVNIDELMSRAPDLLPRMLAEEPGVIAQETTPGQGSPVLRGLSAQSALYLLDGVRYNNATNRGGNTQYFAWIPTVSTGGVEVQLGPSGVNYGSDALGGAINVLTASVPPTRPSGWGWQGSGRVFAGSTTLGGGGDVTLGGAGEQLAGFLSGTGSRHQDVRPGRGEDSRNVLVRFAGLTAEQTQEILGSRLQDTGFGRAGMAGKAVYRTQGAGSFSGFYTHTDQFDVRRYDRLLGGDGRLRASFTPQRLDFGYGRYQDVFGETLFEATVSLNRQSDGREDQRRETSNLGIENNVDTAIGYEAAASWFWGDHSMTVGTEVYDEYVTSTAVEIAPGSEERITVRGRYPDGARYTSFGAFLLDDWAALDGRLLVSAGTRFSAFRFHTEAEDNVIGGVAVVPTNTETFTDLTFNAGATYHFTDTISAFGRVARGFRAPNVNDFGEQGLTGGGFEVSPREAVAAGAFIGTTAGPDAVSSNDPWQGLSPEVLWSFEGGWRWETSATRLEIGVFDSELFDSIARRALILPPGAVGSAIGGATIVDQDELGRVFVATDARPVVSRANIGRKRIHGLELLLQRAWNPRWESSFKMGLQRGEELDTGIPGDKIIPAHFTGTVRWTDPGNDLWIEGVVVGMTSQDRLNPDDIQDARIGAFRTEGQIRDFFAFTAPRLGLVSGGIFEPTGETLDELLLRVLGPGLQGSALFTEMPGFVVVHVRGNYAFTPNHRLMVSAENLFDRNYRVLGSGFDAAGLGLTVAYEADF